MALSLSSLQSKPREDSVHQRRYNIVILTKALVNSRLFFVAFSSPLFKAWESTSLFKAELLVDEEEEDGKEDNEVSNYRQKPSGLRSN